MSQPATELNAGRASIAGSVPLCVDLDGTLLKTDTLVEALMCLVKSNFLGLLRAVATLVRGRAAFKAYVSDLVRINAANLPANEAFVAWLREQHANGRRLVLCTAADRRIAEEVAAHYGIFSQTIATHSSLNLSGRNKAAQLSAQFGELEYDYAGNEVKDLHVWSKARRAIVVAPSAKLRRQLGAVPRLERLFEAEHKPSVRAWLRALRVHQWAKNVLIFVPATTSHRLLEIDVLIGSLIAFILFSLCASGTYLLNDLMDLDDDRQHPTKRHRPFASGQLSLIGGILVGASMILGSVALSLLLLGVTFTGVLALYILVTVWYSRALKRIPMVDVLTLASLYAVRVIAGGAATSIVLSFWLLAFSVFLFFSLAAAKRYVELLLMLAANKTASPGRGYAVEDLSLIQSCGVTAGYLSVLVLALYINSGAVALYSRPQAMWLLCMILLYWINRLWLKTHRGQMHDDPVVFTLFDRPSQLAGVLLVVLLLVAI